MLPYPVYTVDLGVSDETILIIIIIIYIFKP